MAKNNLLGGWAFVIGVILALLIGIGIGSLSSTMTAVLVVIGILVGLMNITDKEVKPFMLASLVVLLASYIGGSTLANVPYIELGGALDAIIAMLVPATIIAALKEVFDIAKK